MDIVKNLARIKVWLVTINIPKYLIKDIKQSSKEIADQELDMNDINDNYEQNIDPEENQLGNENPNQSAPISPVGF